MKQMHLIVVHKVQHPRQQEKEYQTNQSWLLPSTERDKWEFKSSLMEEGFGTERSELPN